MCRCWQQGDRAATSNMSATLCACGTTNPAPIWVLSPCAKGNHWWYNWGMRYPATHKFLAWAGPTLIMFVGGWLALLASLAQTYDGIKNWAQKLFDYCWPIMTAPWFLAALVIVICVYIGVLIYTGGAARLSANPAPALPVDPNVSIQAWVPLPQALRYLVCDSAWARSATWGPRDNPEDLGGVDKLAGPQAD